MIRKKTIDLLFDGIIAGTAKAIAVIIVGAITEAIEKKQPKKKKVKEV